jgi:O-methyltransferase involved in polyketide biosynthesis
MNEKSDTEKLTGVPETLLVALYLRAVETQRADGIIRDEKAVEMIQSIEYDFARFDRAWASQVGVAVRTEILDEATTAFIRQYPHGSVVNMGVGLCTRFNRVDNGRIIWYELDLPEAIEMRRRFFKQTDRYQFIDRSITDFGWMEQIQGEGNQPILFIGEGLFMYFKEQEVKNIFVEMTDHFPGAELLFEINGPVSVGRSKHHDALSKTDGQAEFKWGPASGTVCETWDDRIRFVREWNYLDRHRGRWRFMRLFAYIPPLKRHIMNKIVHLRFRKEGEFVENEEEQRC